MTKCNYPVPPDPVPPETHIKGWHFIQADGRLRDDVKGIQSAHCGTFVYPGQTLEVAAPVHADSWGLHASENIIDALFWAPSLLLCRVELSGQITRGMRQLCATRRRVLWMRDISIPFWDWACERAQWAVDESHRAGYEVPDVCLRALVARRKWIKGCVSDEELFALCGQTRSVSRRLHGRNTRNKRVPSIQIAPLEPRRAAARCEALVANQNAHRHVVAYGDIESAPFRVEDENQLQQMILHSIVASNTPDKFRKQL